MTNAPSLYTAIQREAEVFGQSLSTRAAHVTICVCPDLLLFHIVSNLQRAPDYPHMLRDVAVKLTQYADTLAGSNAKIIS